MLKVLWPGHAPSSSPPATQGLGAWGEFAEAHPFYGQRAANSVTEITGVTFGSFEATDEGPWLHRDGISIRKR